jgi:hypothetical protein
VSKGKKDAVPAAQGKTTEGYRYALAFPYVYFVIVFDRGRYTLPRDSTSATGR